MEVVKNDISFKLTIYHIHNVQTQADKTDNDIDNIHAFNTI